MTPRVELFPYCYSLFPDSPDDFVSKIAKWTISIFRGQSAQILDICWCGRNVVGQRHQNAKGRLQRGGFSMNRHMIYYRQ